jgi:hypothetical protein
VSNAALTTESFIAKAKLVHGEHYDYSLVEYKNARTKVKIICPIHGSWEQNPSSHLSGRGCLACGLTVNLDTKESFLVKAIKTHGDCYDYSLVKYKNTRTKIKIVCKEHGEFLQSPDSHLRGKGCAKCASEASGFTRTKFKDKCIKNNNGLGILYVLECFNDIERFFKIGITSTSIKKRYGGNVAMPYAYKVIDEIIGAPEYIYDLETKLHQLNKENHYVPSIPFGGYATECFKEYKEN